MNENGIDHREVRFANVFENIYKTLGEDKAIEEKAHFQWRLGRWRTAKQLREHDEFSLTLRRNATPAAHRMARPGSFPLETGRYKMGSDMSVNGNSARVTTMEAYHASPQERERTASLMQIVPRGRHSILDVGARDGFYSRLLTKYFAEVTALDLTKPDFEYSGVITVQGNATRLQFPDNSFDCVFCAEVLEHIPDVEAACRELLRVARHEIIVGVPYRQDTRCARTTCVECGRPNPPWGHVNRFDEKRLSELFPNARAVSKSFVGTSREVTNPVSAWLMDIAGNPWGSYDQQEPCIYCGASMRAPSTLSLFSRVCSGIAVRLTAIQRRFVRSHPLWVHVVYLKESAQQGSFAGST